MAVHEVDFVVEQLRQVLHYVVIVQEQLVEHQQVHHLGEAGQVQEGFAGVGGRGEGKGAGGWVVLLELVEEVFCYIFEDLKKLVDSLAFLYLHVFEGVFLGAVDLQDQLVVRQCAQWLFLEFCQLCAQFLDEFKCVVVDMLHFVPGELCWRFLGECESGFMAEVGEGGGEGGQDEVVVGEVEQTLFQELVVILAAVTAKQPLNRGDVHLGAQDDVHVDLELQVLLAVDVAVLDHGAQAGGEGGAGLEAGVEEGDEELV